jgi:hypothetical protein
VSFLDCCPAPRCRADPPSSESRPSSRAGRFAGAATVVTARAPLPCSCVVPWFDVCRRAPICRWHPHAEHATVEPRPYLSLARSRGSTNPRRAHSPAYHPPVSVPCRAHVVGVVPSPRLCRRRFACTHHHRAEALFFLVEPVHAHSRAREAVRRHLCLTSAAGPFLVVPLSLFPCLVYAISFVSPPWPRRRCSARTRTQATEGPSPCFTYL